MEPRATVFSSSGRSDRPSSKNGLGERGRFLGWSAMSWRIWQPPTATEKTAAHTPRRKREGLIIMHLGDVMRAEPLQKARGFGKMKLFVAGLDANKKAV